MQRSCNNKIDVRSLTKEQLVLNIKSQGEKEYRGKQIYEWLWVKSVKSFDEMTNLPKYLRQKLSKKFQINAISLLHTQESNDRTIKNAIKLNDGNIAECVLIPTDRRFTACVSSQVGCSLDCKFCATATLKKKRNIRADEIYDQVVLLNSQSLYQFQSNLSNIVFMGMGEPLLNYNNVMLSINRISSQKWGLGISEKRITLSTSGIPKMIRKLADESQKLGLAVSLHSAIEEKRKRIMPFSLNFPMKELINSFEYWHKKTNRKITFEYIVWKNINDSLEDINALVNLCKRIPSKVNLIEYNSIENDNFISANNSVIELYIDALRKHNIGITIRKSRGKDINAACGQLVNKY